jgi:uncharacterized protein HemY
MGRRPWPTYLWPGLPQILCGSGSWAGLALAFGFAVLVNLALASTLVWSELFATGFRSSVWVAVLIVWGTSALVSYRSDRRSRSSSQAPPAAGAFAEAVDQYLKGNWFQSERVLSTLLAENPRDVDARLTLATLLRRTGRLAEAERQLDRLERLDGSKKWELEIRRERQLFEEASPQTPDDESVPATEAAKSDWPRETADAA